MIKVLVTGGAGFIGSHISQYLVNNGYDVVIIDNLITGKKENIKSFENKVQFIEGDIRDEGLLKDILKGCDYIIHQAAIPSVPRSVADPIGTSDNNIMGTVTLLQSAVERNIKRVVYASSSSVYGDTPTLPKKEDMIPNPLSPYAVAKLTGEYYMKAFNKIYGIETISLRYFNVFGPRQNPFSQYAAVIPKFVNLLKDGKQVTIYGDGEQTRDFTYIENVVQANVKAMTASSEFSKGDIYNVAYGKRISLNELYNKIQEIMGINKKPIYAENRLGDVKHSLADINKAKECLGYVPQVDVYEGLERIIDSILK